MFQYYGLAHRPLAIISTSDSLTIPNPNPNRDALARELRYKFYIIIRYNWTNTPFALRQKRGKPQTQLPQITKLSHSSKTLRFGVTWSPQCNPLKHIHGVYKSRWSLLVEKIQKLTMTLNCWTLSRRWNQRHGPLRDSSQWNSRPFGSKLQFQRHDT